MSTPTALLLSSSSDTAELYDWALHGAGFHVHRAAFGSALPDGLAPDVVIAHMRGPDAAPLRKMMGTKRVPTIVLTGWLEDGITAADAGCDVLMLLPVAPTTLVEKARELLGLPSAVTASN